MVEIRYLAWLQFYMTLPATENWVTTDKGTILAKNHYFSATEKLISAEKHDIFHSKIGNTM